MDETFSRTRAYWLKVAMAVLAVQLVYWFLISPISQQAPLGEFNRIEVVEVAPLKEPSLASVESLPDDAWEKQEIFWYGCCETEHYAFRYDIALDELPKNDLGLITGFGADNSHIWINGYPLVDTGDLSNQGSYDKWVRGVLRVSRAMLREGDNEVIAISARHGGGYTDLYPQTWGDYTELSEAGDRRSFFVNEFRVATMIVVGFVALLALILVPLSRNRAFAFWLAMLAGSLALRIAHLRWSDVPLDPPAYLLTYFAITNLAAVSWFNFLDSWSEWGSWPWARHAMTALFIVLTAISAWQLHQDQASGYDFAGAATDYFLLFTGLMSALLFFWRLWRWPTTRFVEIGIFTLGLTAILLDAAARYLSEWIAGSNMQFALPFLIVGLVASILGRNIKLYESMESFNAELNQKLEQSRTEIEDRHAELLRVQRARDLAEDRQRILRDMHDGIGSQLTGLLVQARAKDLPPDEMERGIETSLHDLRLVVDSLDAESSSLSATLAALRPRLSRQLSAAGISLAWANDLAGEPALNSRDLLQIGRIIQEAVTNIIRHSRAKHASIAVKSDGGMLQLAISDDGRGLPSDDRHRVGHGLRNIKQRAKSLGGEFEMVRGKNGTKLVLRLPADA